MFAKYKSNFILMLEVDEQESGGRWLISDLKERTGRGAWGGVVCQSRSMSGLRGGLR